MQLPRWLRLLLLALFVLWLANQPLVSIAVDWLWFDAIGYLSIFQISLTAKVGMWLGGLLLSGLFLAINLRIAVRDAPIDTLRLSVLLADLGLSAGQLRNLIRGMLALAVGLPALLFAGGAASQWLSVLALLEQEPFGKTDPVFGLDIGFYVFQIPVYDFAQSVLAALVMIALLAVGSYYVARDVFINRDIPALSARARVHLLALGSLFFLVIAAGWWLERFGLLFTHNSVAWGVGYTDLNARLPGFWIMTFCAIGVSVALAVATLQSSWRLPTVGLGLYAVARVLVAGIWPDIVQDYFVKPNELQLEREFIEANIEATNTAYALDRIEVRPFEAEASLTQLDIADNDLTIENVRVWDTRPLLTTYSQIQDLRTYYDFVDVDVDRYLIDGKLRQVMLSARELNYRNVPAQARSWVNEHFQYTHGYGLTLSPVNVVTTEGLPDLFIKDIPPVSSIDMTIERPEIYYGELTDTYVMVNTGADEFDYPMGDENVYTVYAGEGGVPLGALWKKLIFAMHFQSLDILLSQYIEPQSRVMFRRKISDRVSQLAPFLSYDRDPYLVVADGRLFWMLDAYTTSNHYPYSEPSQSGRSQFNYIRNSVKVVVDAYSGRADFYISDPSDPLIRTYARVFQDSFKSLEQMPPSIAKNIRYPSDFFDVQAQMYRSYHMKESTVFYNKEDMWDLPRELYDGQELPMDSYYLIMKLPEEEQAEFILLLPFVPTGKDNMISWLAARCDTDHYGKLILYQFPKQKLIYGPRQIEARIDQNPEISEMITLWSQAGSRVVRGNLLVIPISNSLMYVEPLYLQAESSQLPELKRVIVSYENRIAMRETLDESIKAVFAPGEIPLIEPDAVDGGSGPAPRAIDTAHPQWAQLAGKASELLRDATEQQRAGDWAGYGESLKALTDVITELHTQAAGSLDDGALDDGAQQDEAPPEAPPAP